MNIEGYRKFLYRSRLKRVFVVGILFGCIAGSGATGWIIYHYYWPDTTSVCEQQAKKTAAVQSELKTKEEELERIKAKQNNDKKLQEQISDPAALLASSQENWSIALVNYAHPLSQSYAPKLKELVEGKSVDERIYEEAKQMIEAAQKAGVSLNICSAYRSYEDQKNVFQDTMNEWIFNGSSTIDAFYATNKSVALPGESEHATGLALDITSAEYTELDEKQASTDTAKWLQAHCAEYGFILRYPPEKSEITKIIYEPWHYRYVGKEIAGEIMSSGVTLEEYWENKLQ